MKVPFFPNTGDGTHCWQASLKMALASFEPEKEFSYDELDKISGKVPGKWTWPTTSMLWLLDRGYELILKSDFDYADFAKRGEKYLQERCGEEVAKAQIANSIVSLELAAAKKLAASGIADRTLPTLFDLRNLLASGYVLICNVNAATLHWIAGYSAHFVVVTEITEQFVTLHDPGLPPKPNFQVSVSSFEAAWAYPEARDRNVLALKK